MTPISPTRLSAQHFQLDVDGLRHGRYADKYFANIQRMLIGNIASNRFEGAYPRYAGGLDGLDLGNLEVEMQVFTRHAGSTVVVGIDHSLAQLRACTGEFIDGAWIDRSAELDVEAIYDGDTVSYKGDPTQVEPVIRIRGRYRDFAILETTILGILSRSSRIATNVTQVLNVSRGKPVLFFPARFDLPETQAADGYAYKVAVDRYNARSGHSMTPFVSTDAQGAWWGGAGGGTMAHAAIACFLSDTAETMRQFAKHVPVGILRAALVDFNNDCVTDSLRTAEVLFRAYAFNILNGHPEEAEKYRLHAVRLDTSGSNRDISVPMLGDKSLDNGVNPRLVTIVREALDRGWIDWDLTEAEAELAESFCKSIQIVVTGGFSADKIDRFEKAGVPADIYGVGSSLLRNDKTTNCDFTADIVRVKINGEWKNMAKIGRAPADNPGLKPVDMSQIAL